MKNTTITRVLAPSLVRKMMRERAVRTTLTKESFLYFFHFYYAHYVKYETADFQKEMFHLLESSPKENLYVVAFRGSGKSTIITTAYPLWAILGKQQKKFCVIFTQTRVQAKQHMMNIRTELENNELLKRDLGPFKEESDEWGSFSLVFKKHNARITVASTEQSIRGIRHNEHRPDVLICDDVEDVQSTKTREGREKTYHWLRGEVIPTGDKDTRLIVVGNLLHEDSLLMKIKSEVAEGRTSGVFKQYPLLDRNDQCLWSGKYPDELTIEEEKKKVGSEISWQREYLLRIIPSDDQVIYPEWIQYYDELPGEDHVSYRGTYVGVDLAISSKDSADDTAVIMAHVYSRREKLRIYILPTVISKKLNFPAQVDLMKDIYNMYIKDDETGEIFVESIAYQEALPQMLEHEGIEAQAIKPKGDKRTRLSLTSTAIKSGIIKFPKKGCASLIKQMVGFGVEKHDDMADAFSLLVNAVLSKHSNESDFIIGFIGGSGPDHFVDFDDYIDVD